MEDNKMEHSGTAVVENYFTAGEGTGDFLLTLQTLTYNF